MSQRHSLPGASGPINPSASPCGSPCPAPGRGPCEGLPAPAAVELRRQGLPSPAAVELRSLICYHHGSLHSQPVPNPSVPRHAPPFLAQHRTPPSTVSSLRLLPCTRQPGALSLPLPAVSPPHSPPSSLRQCPAQGLARRRSSENACWLNKRGCQEEPGGTPTSGWGDLNQVWVVTGNMHVTA